MTRIEHDRTLRRLRPMSSSQRAMTKKLARMRIAATAAATMILRVPSVMTHLPSATITAVAIVARVRAARKPI